MAITDKVITYKAENKVLKFITIGLIAFLSIATIVMSVLFIVVPRGGGSLTSVENIVFEKTGVGMTVNSEEYITYTVQPDTATNTDIEFIGRTTDGNYLSGQEVLANVSTVLETNPDGTSVNRIKIKTFGIEGSFTIKLKSKQRPNLAYEIPVTVVRKFVQSFEFVESPTLQKTVDNLMFLKKQGDADTDTRRLYIKVAPVDATELNITTSVTDNDGNKVPGLVVDGSRRAPAKDDSGNVVPGVYTIPAITTISGLYKLNFTTVTAEGDAQLKSIPVKIFDAVHSVEYKNSDGKGILELSKGKNVDIKDVIKINVKNENGNAESVPVSQMDSMLDGLKFDTTDVLVIDKPQLLNSKIITASTAFTGVQSSLDAAITVTSSFENGKQLGAFNVRIKVPVTSLEIDRNIYTYYLKRETGSNTAIIKALLTSSFKAEPYNSQAIFKINRVYKDGRDVTLSSLPADKVISIETSKNECKVTAQSYGMAEIAVTSADNPDIEARVIKIYIKELGISLDNGATFNANNSAILNYQVNTTLELKDVIYVRSHEAPASITKLNAKNPSINISFTADGAGKSDYNKAQCAFFSAAAIENVTDVALNLKADAGTGEWSAISNTLSFTMKKHDFVSDINLNSAKTGDNFYYEEDTSGKVLYSYYVGNNEMTGQMYNLSDLVSLKMTSGLAVPAAQKTLKYTSDAAVSIRRVEISSGVFADCIIINSFSETPISITIELLEKRSGLPGIDGDTSKKVTFTVTMIRKITQATVLNVGAMKDSTGNIVSYKNNKQEYIVADNGIYLININLGFSTVNRDLYKLVSSNTDIVSVEIDGTDGHYYLHTNDVRKKTGDSDPNVVTLSLHGVRIVNLSPVEYHIKDILVRVATDVSSMAVSMQGRTDSDVAPYRLKINGDYNQDNGGIVINFRGEAVPLNYRDFAHDLTARIESEDPVSVLALFGAKGFEIIPQLEGKNLYVKFYFDTEYKYALSAAPDTMIDGDAVLSIQIETESAAVYTFQYNEEIEQGESTTVVVVGTTGGSSSRFKYSLRAGSGNTSCVSFATTPTQTTATNDIVTARVLSSAAELTPVHIIVTIVEEGKEDESIQKDIYIKIKPITVSFIKSGTPEGISTITPNNPGINDANNTIIFTSDISNRNTYVSFAVNYNYSNINLITPTVDNSIDNKSVLTVKGKPGLIGGNVILTVTYTFTLLSDAAYKHELIKTYNFTVEGINPNIEFFVNSETIAATTHEVDAGTSDFILTAKTSMYPVNKYDWKFRIASDVHNLTNGTSFSQGGNITDGIFGEFGVGFKLDIATGGTVVIEAVLEFDGMFFTRYFTVTVLPPSVDLKLTHKPAGETPSGSDLFDSITLRALDTVRVTGTNASGNGVPAMSFSADRTDLVSVDANGVVTAKKGTFGGAVKITATTASGAAYYITINVFEVTINQFIASATANNSAFAVNVKQGEKIPLGWSLTHSDSATDSKYNNMINTADGFAVSVAYSYTGLLGTVTGTDFAASKSGLGGKLLVDARITLTDKTGAVLNFNVKTPDITVKELELAVKSDKNDIPQGGTATFEVDVAKITASSANALDKLEIAEIVQGNSLIETKSVNAQNKAIVKVKTGAIGGAIEIKFKVTIASVEFYRNVTVNVIAKTIDFNFKAYSDSALTNEFTGTLTQGGTVYFDVVSKLNTTDIIEDSISYTANNANLVKDSAEDNKFVAQTNWVGGTVSVQAKVTIDGIDYYLTYNIDIQVIRPDNITLGITTGSGTAFNPATDTLAQGGERLNLSVVADSYINSANQTKAPVFKIISGSSIANFDSINKAMLLSKSLSSGGNVVIEVTVYPEKQIFSYIFTIKVATLNLTMVSGDYTVEQGGSIDNYITLSAGNQNVTDTNNIKFSVIEGAALINGISFHNQNGIELIYKYKTLNSFGGTLRIMFTVRESSAVGADVWSALEVSVKIKTAVTGVNNKNLSYVVDQGAEQAYDFGFIVPAGFTATTELLSTTGEITVNNLSKKVTANITGNTVVAYGVATFKTKIVSNNYPADYKEIETVLSITVNPIEVTVTGLADPMNLAQNTEYKNINYNLTGIVAGKVTAAEFSLSNSTLADITSAQWPGAFKTKNGTLGGDVKLILTITLNGGARIVSEVAMRVKPISKFDYTVTPAFDTVLTSGNTYAVSVSEATLGNIAVTGIEIVSIGGNYIIDSISSNNINIKSDTLGGVVTLKITMKVLGIEQHIFHDIYVEEIEPTITYTADGGSISNMLYYDSRFVLAPIVSGHYIGSSSSFTLLDNSYGTVTNNGNGTATLSIGGADKRTANKNLILSMRLNIDGREYYRTLVFIIEGIQYQYNGLTTVNHGGTINLSFNAVKGFSTSTQVPVDKVSYTLEPTDLGTLTGNVFTAKSNVRSGTVKIQANISFHAGALYTETLTIAINGIVPAFMVIDKNNANAVINNNASFNQGVTVRPELQETAISATNKRFTGFEITEGTNLAIKKEFSAGVYELVFLSNTNGGKVVLKLTYEIDGVEHSLNLSLNINKVSISPSYTAGTEVLEGNDIFSVEVDVTGVDATLVSYNFMVSGDKKLYGDDLRVNGNIAELTAAHSFTGGELYLIITITINNVDTGSETYSRIIGLTVKAITVVKAQISGGDDSSVYDSNQAVVLELTGIDGLQISNVLYRTASGTVIAIVNSAPFTANYTLPVISGTVGSTVYRLEAVITLVSGESKILSFMVNVNNMVVTGSAVDNTPISHDGGTKNFTTLLSGLTGEFIMNFKIINKDTLEDASKYGTITGSAGIYTFNAVYGTPDISLSVLGCVSVSGNNVHESVLFDISILGISPVITFEDKEFVAGQPIMFFSSVAGVSESACQKTYFITNGLNTLVHEEKDASGKVIGMLVVPGITSGTVGVQVTYSILGNQYTKTAEFTIRSLELKITDGIVDITEAFAGESLTLTTSSNIAGAIFNYSFDRAGMSAVSGASVTVQLPYSSTDYLLTITVTVDVTGEGTILTHTQTINIKGVAPVLIAQAEAGSNFENGLLLKGHKVKFSFQLPVMSGGYTSQASTAVSEGAALIALTQQGDGTVMLEGIRAGAVSLLFKCIVKDDLGNIVDTFFTGYDITVAEITLKVTPNSAGAFNNDILFKGAKVNFEYELSTLPTGYTVVTYPVTEGVSAYINVVGQSSGFMIEAVANGIAGYVTVSINGTVSYNGVNIEDISQSYRLYVLDPALLNFSTTALSINTLYTVGTDIGVNSSSIDADIFNLLKSEIIYSVEGTALGMTDIKLSSDNELISFVTGDGTVVTPSVTIKARLRDWSQQTVFTI